MRVQGGFISYSYVVGRSGVAHRMTVGLSKKSASICSTAVDNYFWVTFSPPGNFMIVYLFCFFLSSGKSVCSSEWRCALRLEPREGLEKMAPMMAIYLESTSLSCQLA